MSGLRELLDAATPPTNETWSLDRGTRHAYVAASTRLRNMAPDMARLLLDMADALRSFANHDDHAHGCMCGVCLNEESLLARFDHLAAGSGDSTG